MNLTTEAWIPVARADGTPERVSLHGAFAQGSELRDLAVRPHERIALMRLLICIAQAALDGPEDEDEWQSCRSRIAPASICYLDQWHHAFELFGVGPRFLQMANLERPENKKKAANGAVDSDATAASKLDLALATGHNTTLFDNSGGSRRTIGLEHLPLMLLTYQCFSPSGTIGVASWNGKPTPGGRNSNHAPCVANAMLHALLRGDTLLDTLHRNLMTKRQADRFFGHGKWGRPVWEAMPAGPDDTVAANNAGRTYLGRLAPLSRAVRFEDDSQSLLLANGLEYASYPSWREPSATVVVRENENGQPERRLVRVSILKAAWRELQALTVKTISEGPNSVGGPAALANVQEEKSFDLWVGGLVADQGKPVDTVESVFRLPLAMLEEPSQRAYEKGVHYSESMSRRLAAAVRAYHNEIGDKLDRPEMKNRRQLLQDKCTAHYWSDVEAAVPLLLELASDPRSLSHDDVWPRSAWGQEVWRVARDAYERVCPHNTARQIRAYAMGLRAMHFAPEKNETRKSKRRLKSEQQST